MLLCELIAELQAILNENPNSQNWEVEITLPDQTTTVNISTVYAAPSLQVVEIQTTKAS